MNVGRELQMVKQPRSSSQLSSTLKVFPPPRNIFRYLRYRRTGEIQGITKRRKPTLTKNRDLVLHPATSHFIDSNVMNISSPIRIPDVLALVG